MGALPSGTVTLVLADIEGSTRLWDSAPSEMATAIANLDSALVELIPAHHGVRPLEQGEGDSFVAAFGRASDAVACALALQRRDLAPLALRIGIHTGDVDLRDVANYFGQTINRTARLRDLAHGGQTVLSQTTAGIVADDLPDGVWLSSLGIHPLRDLPRPEAVWQLCHEELQCDQPPLRTSTASTSRGFPLHLTSFVGRNAQIDELSRLLGGDHRLVTLTGAGGVGKTRLAVQVARGLNQEVVFVDLAGVGDSSSVALVTARALGLADQPGRSTLTSIIDAVDGRPVVLLLDNCEHVVDAVDDFTVDVLTRTAQLHILATSREPLGVAGEVTWRVPSLVLAEALELFVDRARLVQPMFAVHADNRDDVAEICRRLDGMPLAIELAAARLRTLTPAEIRESLRDCFRLLVGGSRVTVRRQQTLRASVEWSYGLLTEPEQMLFYRLSVFAGGFDHSAVVDVASDDRLGRHQIPDLLSLLVDKSLVSGHRDAARMRFRLPETVRQFGQEKLVESGEADRVRRRHRDYFHTMASALDVPVARGHVGRVEGVAAELDDLRAAFTWSLEIGDATSALELVSSLLPVWLARGRVKEGLGWLDEVRLDDVGTCVPDATRVRALADKAVLGAWTVATSEYDAREALAIARDLDDKALILRALTACGAINAFSPDVALQYMDEAADLARELGDGWRLCQVLAFKQYAAQLAGDLPAVIEAGTEGRALADQVGDRFTSRMCRLWLGTAQCQRGEIGPAATMLDDVVREADDEHDLIHGVVGRISQAYAHALIGRQTEALTIAQQAVRDSVALGPFVEGFAHGALSVAALAVADIDRARAASSAAAHLLTDTHKIVTTSHEGPLSQIALAEGNLGAALRHADSAVSVAGGWHLVTALIGRARIFIAREDMANAVRDAHRALEIAVDIGAEICVVEVLECLARVEFHQQRFAESVRLLGAAVGIRQRLGVVRYQIYDADIDSCIQGLRSAVGNSVFCDMWSQASSMTILEAVGYAQRGRGERCRSVGGWEALTPAERRVVRLLAEGLGNKDIAARLFISPRTVQTHLTHVYAKVGVASRVALAQLAARNPGTSGNT
jgi:predicted ATPase/class 3 adenylate cyclase/DNA-binding CsgD family transcriptional regulator